MGLARFGEFLCSFESYLGNSPPARVARPSGACRQRESRERSLSPISVNLETKEVGTLVSNPPKGVLDALFTNNPVIGLLTPFALRLLDAFGNALACRSRA